MRPRLTKMTNLVSENHPAPIDVQCPKCGAENVPLRGGGVKAYLMMVRDERGEHVECASCSHAWVL